MRSGVANSSHSRFQNAHEISIIISSSAGVLLADIYGSIHLLNKTFEPVKSWVAHVGGRVTHMVDGKGTLITIGYVFVEP